MRALPRFNQPLFRETFSRIAEPYTLAEIAAFTGVSAPTLSRLERGHTPSVDVFLAVCAWMGVSAGVFTDGSLEVRESSVCLACVNMRTRLAQIEALATGGHV
jgi:transcriptional regulator with XRE-family HTH domain